MTMMIATPIKYGITSPFGSRVCVLCLFPNGTFCGVLGLVVGSNR
nr:hypothetical protein JVH1_0622 [Rhodococcus sp. JVH1]